MPTNETKPTGVKQPAGLYDELLDRVEASLNERKISDAEKFLAAALQQDKTARAYFLLGQIYYEKGEYAHAASAYKKTLVLDPQFVDASISLSILYNDLGQYEEGSFIFNRAERAVQTHEKGSDPYLNEKLARKHKEFGELYLKYNRYQEALDQFQKASNLRPDDPEARFNIAQTLYKDDKKLQALNDLLALKKDCPRYISGRVLLGLVRYSLGHVIEAVEEWEKILEKDPENDKAKSYLKLARGASTTIL